MSRTVLKVAVVLILLALVRRVLPIGEGSAVSRSPG